jgi:hypothetical protein
MSGTPSESGEVPISDRLIHDLAIVTPTDSGTLDGYGHPVAGDPVVTLVVGLIQPKSAREIALTSQAGAMLSDHVVFLLPQTLSNAAYIRYEPDDGDRYEIVGIRTFDFGRDPHLEVDAKRVLSPSLAAEAS